MNSICNLQLSGTSKKSTSEICTQNGMKIKRLKFKFSSYLGILVSDLGTSTSIHTTSIVYPKAELNAVIVRDVRYAVLNFEGEGKISFYYIKRCFYIRINLSNTICCCHVKFLLFFHMMPLSYFSVNLSSIFFSFHKFF